VILRPGHSLALDGLVSFLMTKEIAKFKLPERLLLCQEFPVSTFGKVSKKALADMAEQQAGTDDAHH
jgi:2,3-dihydroxybenzoate-AMP ligase